MTEELVFPKIFTYKDVLAKCLDYFNGDELAATTWMNKYAMKNKDGEFLESSPEDMHTRMAAEFARIEKKYDDGKKDKEGLSEYGKERKSLDEKAIFELFQDFKYTIPQGSVMSSLGNKNVIASLSNCVVVPPVYDSYGGIFHTDEQLAQLFKRRCGVGVDLSNLRPNGATVSNSAGSTTGAVSFMHRFSNTTREVAQNGRRGALMLTMDIAHPDVEDFVTIKQDLKKVTGANISLRLSDEFMMAVVNDDDYTLRWPIDSKEPVYKKTIKAKELWDTIIKCAHNTAEPGLIFWDRQHYYSTSSIYPGFENSSTNPCSEIAMQGGDSCRLIAVNLYSFVKNPFTDKASFDYKKFYKVVYETQRLMDDLVDLELEAVDKIFNKIMHDKEPMEIKQVEIDTWKLLYKAGKTGRRTGLGFTALADAVAALGLKFDTDEAIAVVDDIMKVKFRGEFDSSIDMAITRGKFKVFNPEIEKYSEFVQMIEKEFPDIYKRMMKYGRRNISISTVAPTGSLSMLAQTSSGIEPVFLLSYKRRRKVNAEDEGAKVAYVDDMGDEFEEFDVYHNKLKKWMEISGETDIEKSPYKGATAPEIDWKKRVEMQALVQKYTTHSISSTINLAKDVSVDLVGDIYIDSWKKGLKGITVYRDGSRSGILVSNDDKKDTKREGCYAETIFPKRPKTIDAKVVRFQNDYDKWVAVVGLINNRPYEIFTGKLEDAFLLPAWLEEGWVIKNKDDEGNTRYDFQFADKQGYKVTLEGLSRTFDKEYWNYAKLISGVLRHGMPIPYVVDLVNNLNMYDTNINTWKNGIARTLKQFVVDGTEAVDKKCPECGDPEGLIYEEGCLKCKSCGHSKCG
ncbi:adenosylcobalamin-dependent ribonucleoside-diphosphate reductase [Lutibacter sp. TH_r2]|uniref:adenosylcobalamin-dependent ribonucleoside-diphosphate reductase n=1 Tax=Lutibacter sp. TH_r2 TaxID=3082083 RepID=UPI002952EB74|nr:adenosylcobalamin-dependent ribonucleoside-diphosphate reductase [Lutibacter sp. TH_r2]MDV7185790.1 adenosylcobalamin-dependent ribonucleoside-diphosphate reductase [Lutibacter sp. TH_r2]